MGPPIGDQRFWTGPHGYLLLPNCLRSIRQGTRSIAHFWYARALERFNEVTKSDPGCAVAYWGAAMTYNHPFWGTLHPKRTKQRRGRWSRKGSQHRKLLPERNSISQQWLLSTRTPVREANQSATRIIVIEWRLLTPNIRMTRLLCSMDCPYLVPSRKVPMDLSKWSRPQSSSRSCMLPSGYGGSIRGSRGDLGRAEYSGQKTQQQQESRRY
jgi:hypothetical protein